MFTKVFKSGNSLAIRIPKEFAEFFSGTQVKIHKGKNNTIVLEKVNDDWSEIFAKCYEPDFPAREEINFALRDEL